MEENIDDVTDYHESLEPETEAESDLMILLPCPFCGGIDLSCDGHYVLCDNCGANGPSIHPVPNGRKANELWNHREG